MKLIRAQRESDWPLPLIWLHCSFLLNTTTIQRMEAMPDEVPKQFIHREHTKHNTDGISNGIWSDMAIETTYMRYGHCQAVIIGVTLKHGHTVCTYATVWCQILMRRQIERSLYRPCTRKRCLIESYQTDRSNWLSMTQGRGSPQPSEIHLSTKKALST